MAKASRGGRRGGGQLPRPTRIPFPEDQNGSDGLTPAKRKLILQPDIDRFQKNYGIDLIGFEKMNINTARKVIDKAEEAIIDFNLTGKDLPKIDVISKMPQHYIGQFAYYDSGRILGIELNTRWYLDKNNTWSHTTYDRGTKKNHHPQGTVLEDVITHEIGHAVQLKYFKKMGRAFADEGLLVGQAVANVEKVNFPKKGFLPASRVNTISAAEAQEIRTFSSIMRKAKESISAYANSTDKYGRSMYNETISEAFTDVYANGNKANKYSREIMRLLKKDY